MAYGAPRTVGMWGSPHRLGGCLGLWSGMTPQAHRWIDSIGQFRKVAPICLVTGTLLLTGCTTLSGHGSGSASDDTSPTAVSDDSSSSDSGNALTQASIQQGNQETVDAAEAQNEAAEAEANQDMYNANVMPVPSQ